MEEYVISYNAKLIEVLLKLDNQSSNRAMTIFVIDEKNRVIGSITDGDIRRSILKTASLNTPIKDVMCEDFRYLEQDRIDVSLIKKLKSLNIKLVPILDPDKRLVGIVNLGEKNSYLPLDAVLMAGGKGERLRPMTLETPKPLLKVGDKPIIDYNIENLQQNGVENISVTVNYLAEQIEKHFEGTCVKCIREPQYLGTIGSIKFVENFHNDSILIMNSDLFTNIDLEDFFLHFKKHDADMSVVAVPYSVSVPYGIFDIENMREIKGVREKPSYHYYANAGIYLIKKDVLNEIPENKFFNATDLIDKLVEKNKKVIRFPLSGYWIDIGKPEDFSKVQEFAKHIRKT